MRRVQLFSCLQGIIARREESSADRFAPHCCRHWLVTHLLRDGMSRNHVKWIRGDAMKESIDINPVDSR